MQNLRFLTRNGLFRSAPLPYYDVDQGVEPDYIIRNYENFYNREALTEYINSLF